MECIIKVLFIDRSFRFSISRVRGFPPTPWFNVDTLSVKRKTPPSPGLPTLNPGGGGDCSIDNMIVSP